MLETIERDGGETPRHCFDGAILLADGAALEFFDRLRQQRRELGVDELRYLTAIAAATREVGNVLRRKQANSF